MTLSIHMLMHIYQFVSLSWRLNADVLVQEHLFVTDVLIAVMSIVGRCRIYYLNGLSVKHRCPRKGLATGRLLLLYPDSPNLTSSMDFIMDELEAIGHRIKCLTGVNYFT
nr:hypothetical protein EATA8330_44490 [Enterobacter asburiae]